MNLQLKDEFIGLNIIVTHSKNKSQIGMKGKIVEETRNTFILKTKDGEKKLIKNSINFQILENGIEVDGRKIVGKPEDRIKR